MPRGKRSSKRRRRGRKTKLKTKVQAIVARTLRSSEPLHYCDEYSTSQALTTAATFTRLTDAIDQGDGATNRQADRINIRRLSGKFIFHRDQAATQALCVCRVILFKWFPDTSADAPAAGTDIIYDQTNNFTGSPLTMLKVNRRKFAVIKDWYFNLAVPGDSGSVKIFQFEYRPKARMGIIDYSPAANDAKGHYYLMTLCNQSSAGTEGAFVRYHATLHFEP